jgi:RNA recognition motif-containing protein
MVSTVADHFRNLAFETTDDILREKFISFGDVKLAIVCKYPGTNHSKGSGFIHFVERTSADACIIAADTVI